ncbi:MAG: adventurous gliding motility protein AgmC, partial [Polyangiaceae bacterium]
INSTSITVDDSSVFLPGDMVLIWETTGIQTPTSGDPTATDLSSSTAGTYEFGRVKATPDATTVTLTNPTISAYAGVAQLVRIPEYTTLDITAGGIAAAPWDGAKGGIAVVFANGAVTNTGSFDTSFFGFRGGVLLNDDAVYGCANLDGPVTDGVAIPPGGGATFNALAGGAKKGEGLFPAGYNTDITNPTSATNLVTYGRGNLSSGAGGGDCHNSGGGGGGHGGAGGQGGGTWVDETDATGLINTGDRMVGGLGGTSVSYSPTTHLVFGGGAGAGEENNTVSTPGGSGGGVLLIRAASIAGAGSFISDGASGGAAGNDGAGGG